MSQLSSLSARAVVNKIMNYNGFCTNVQYSLCGDKCFNVFDMQEDESVKHIIKL